MIIVEGYVRMANAADFKKVRAVGEAQIASSLAEAGCIDYTYAIDVLDGAIMRVLEIWQSWEALESHFKEPHMSVWRAALAGVNILERDLRAHETGETRAL